MFIHRPRAGRSVPTPVFKPKVDARSEEQQIAELTPVKLKAPSTTVTEAGESKAVASSATKEADPQTPVKKTVLVPMLSP